MDDEDERDLLLLIFVKDLKLDLFINFEGLKLTFELFEKKL